MGVKYYRDYDEILQDFAGAISGVDGFYELIGMEAEDWGDLQEKEQAGCVETMADDLFFALGETNPIHLGKGSIMYDEEHRVIKVYCGENMVRIINLE